MSRFRREIAVAAAYVVLLVILAIARPAFFSGGQFHGGWVQSAPVLVTAVGMTLVLLARHVDISVGSQFSICAVIAGLAAKSGMPMPLAALVAVLAGCAMGAVNGVLVAFMGLPSIVVTLATLVILREGLRFAREGEAVHDLPASFQWFGQSQHMGEWDLIVAAALVLTAFSIIMKQLSAGRAVYAVGSDPEAARLAGLRPPVIVFGVFVLMGGLTGLAAVMNAIRFAQVDVNSGQGLELTAIAAVVVGGTAIAGGRGTLIGTLAGVALLGTIGPALYFLRINPYWQLAVQGMIILLAVAADGLPTRGARHA